MSHLIDIQNVSHLGVSWKLLSHLGYIRNVFHLGMSWKS